MNDDAKSRDQVWDEAANDLLAQYKKHLETSAPPTVNPFLTNSLIVNNLFAVFQNAKSLDLGLICKLLANSEVLPRKTVETACFLWPGQGTELRDSNGRIVTVSLGNNAIDKTTVGLFNGIYIRYLNYVVTGSDGILGIKLYKTWDTAGKNYYSNSAGRYGYTLFEKLPSPHQMVLIETVALCQKLTVDANLELLNTVKRIFQVLCDYLDEPTPDMTIAETLITRIRALSATGKLETKGKEEVIVGKGLKLLSALEAFAVSKMEGEELETYLAQVTELGRLVTIL